MYPLCFCWDWVNFINNWLLIATRADWTRERHPTWCVNFLFWLSRRVPGCPWRDVIVATCQTRCFLSFLQLKTEYFCVIRCLILYPRPSPPPPLGSIFFLICASFLFHNPSSPHRRGRAASPGHPPRCYTTTLQTPPAINLRSVSRKRISSFLTAGVFFFSIFLSTTTHCKSPVFQSRFPQEDYLMTSGKKKIFEWQGFFFFFTF